MQDMRHCTGDSQLDQSLYETLKTRVGAAKANRLETGEQMMAGLVREAAADALWELEKDGKPYLPRLRAALKREADEIVRMKIESAINYIEDAVLYQGKRGS